MRLLSVGGEESGTRVFCHLAHSTLVHPSWLHAPVDCMSHDKYPWGWRTSHGRDGILPRLGCCRIRAGQGPYRCRRPRRKIQRYKELPTWHYGARLRNRRALGRQTLETPTLALAQAAPDGGTLG